MKSSFYFIFMLSFFYAWAVGRKGKEMRIFKAEAEEIIWLFLTFFCKLLQEKILEVEYIKAVVPRKEEEPSLHNDWVSAVDGSNPG